MGTVWGEPLSQTAQSFMPELIYGAKQSLKKVCSIWTDEACLPMIG